MVYGQLIGKVKENQVYVEDAFAITHWDAYHVELDTEGYVKLARKNAKLFEEHLSSSAENFIIGWYCSIQDEHVKEITSQFFEAVPKELDEKG